LTKKPSGVAELDMHLIGTNRRTAKKIRSPDIGGTLPFVSLIILYAVILLPHIGQCGFTLTNLAGFQNLRSLTLSPGRDGFIYGQTDTGGDFGQGFVLRMSKSGEITTLVSFNSTNGTKNGKLVQAANGSLYGVNGFGDPTKNPGGTVFEVTTNGSLRTLAVVNGTNGNAGFGQLIEGSDGAFYGVGFSGGIYTNVSSGLIGFGTLFRVDTNGSFSLLHWFHGTNGANPTAPLLQDKDGSFFGTTMYGGAYNLGTVWKLSPGGAFTVLASFDSTNGAKPGFGLARGTDGSFYGVTLEGGTNPPANYAGGTTCGTLFKITNTGVLTSLISFSKNDCVRPTGTPEQGPDGNWYCTSYFGGDTTHIPGVGNGTVFQLSSSGKLSIPVAFPFPAYTFPPGIYTNGAWPTSGLIPGPNGSFFGIAGIAAGGPPAEFIFQVVPTGGDNLTDPARAMADDDGDGFSNLFEYAVGSDLANAGDGGQGLVLHSLQQGGINSPTMNFKRRPDAATLQMQYIPEVSSDGQTWYSDPTHVQEVGVTHDSDRFDWVTVITPSSVASAPTFWRLRVGWGSPISSPAMSRSPVQTRTATQIRSWRLSRY
jgi:uncharacterized repeat protein (TIGR03803 family)